MKSAADEDEDEDEVFPATARPVTVFRGRRNFVFLNSQETNWWTEPSGQTQPQTTRPRNSVTSDGDRGQDEGGEERPGRDGRRHGEQRVEVEEGLDVADVVFAGEMRPEEQPQEQGEEEGLDDDAHELQAPVFLRPFFFQWRSFSRSIRPSPRLAASLR